MTIKQERVAHLVHNILSDLLMTEVTDPALQDVTITSVKLDRELEYAQVYVHSLEDRDVVMAGLQRANGFLRRELAARVRLRKAPVLQFHWDVALEHGERIDSLLDSLHLNSSPEENPEFDDDGLEQSD